jgi:hypothetical protein
MFRECSYNKDFPIKFTYSLTLSLIVEENVARAPTATSLTVI